MGLGLIQPKSTVRYTFFFFKKILDPNYCNNMFDFSLPELL